MNTIKTDELFALFETVANVFAEKKDELCEMDAKLGDGDLGLTMARGFGAMPELIKENEEPDNVGKTLFKSAMKMASVAPSSMGTLMASGIMEGGKRLNNIHEITAAGLADFWDGFAAGIKKRGKCEPGDCTVLDAADSAAKAAKEEIEKNPQADLETVAKAARDGAEKGLEATKSMKPKFGKAAVHESAAEGMPDQGAFAGFYFTDAVYRHIVFSKG